MDVTALAFIAVTAFFASLGHCVGMCGGFVVAYSSTKINTEWTKTKTLFAHTLYNLGRTLSYMLIGACVGAIGSVFLLHPYAKATIYALTAFIMLFVGLWLLGVHSFARQLEFDFTKLRLFKTAFSKLLVSQSQVSFFSVGILNGFFPCGLVYFFASYAAASGSALSGALIMGVFGLSTMIPLFAVGIAADLLQKSQLRAAAAKISAIAILGFSALGFWHAISLFR